jgi:hypothetical protein
MIRTLVTTLKLSAIFSKKAVANVTAQIQDLDSESTVQPITYSDPRGLSHLRPIFASCKYYQLKMDW